MAFWDRLLGRPEEKRPDEKHRAASRGGSARLTGGGIINPGTGLGTGLDKTEGSFFQPTRYFYRAPLETMYIQSAAARKFVDIPVDDMFIRWRMWAGEDESAAEAMQEAEDRHKVPSRLAQAMKAARAYGTCVLIIVTSEAPLEEALDPKRIRPGDLKALRVFDRFDLSAWERERDIFSPNFGLPEQYHVHPTGGQSLPFRVHHSRVIRFDGIQALTDSRFWHYDQDWGVSCLVPVITSILEDQTLASAVAHMSQEASIPVLGISELRDKIAGTGGRGEASVADIGRAVNEIKSVYRLLMLDKNEEEFTRVAVQFAGIADLMDRYAQRLAAAADIPMTRWMGQSPAGMNATGDSDMKNYVMMLEANREKQLADALPRLDDVVARDAGLREAPEYEWLSLLEMGEEEQALVAKTKAEAMVAALGASILDEDEAREALSGDSVFGELTGPAPEPDPEMLPGAGGFPGGGGDGPPSE